jgi:flagellar biosynthetic protein FliS
MGGVRAVGRALDIVLELEATLDRTQGPELTQNLSQVYSFVASLLLQANTTYNAKPVLDAERLLAPIVEAFTLAAATLAAGAGGSHASR